MLNPVRPSANDGDTWKTESEAAAGYADILLLAANILHMKGVTQAGARRAAWAFTDAAWGEMAPH